MKFDYKTILIIVLLITTVILIIPRMSFADQMSPAAPGPSPSVIKCQTTPIPIASICPSDYPRTGDMTPEGMKFCCK